MGRSQHVFDDQALLDRHELAEDALATISRFHLPASLAEEILRETLSDLQRKAPYLSQPRVWITATIRRRCIEALRRAPRPTEPTVSAHRLQAPVREAL